ncbi:MAG: hypothetical protein LBT55_04110 [Clostridiaceae bacterium]|jgi:hypothetical protein|nr:hypothetical protein [Clostridiaceae bacterium]
MKTFVKQSIVSFKALFSQNAAQPACDTGKLPVRPSQSGRGDEPTASDIFGTVTSEQATASGETKFRAFKRPTPLSLSARKIIAVALLSLSALAALASLLAVIYAITVATYANSLLLFLVIFAFAALFLTVAAMAFFAALIPAKPYAVAESAACEKFLKKPLRVFLICTLVLFALSLAFNGLSHTTWLNETRDLRESYGFSVLPVPVTVIYYGVAEIEQSKVNSDITIEKSSDTVKISYTERFAGHVKIENKPYGEDRSRLIITSFPLPDYPKIVWWAFV